MQSAHPIVDPRRAPRAFGTLIFRYHRAPGGAADIDAWVGGGPARSPQRAPDPTMNFSAIGIAFDDLATCDDGDVLLFELGIPGEPGLWRGGASVVRISTIPIDERDEFVVATHRVAISLDTFPADGVTALQAYTDRTRRANGRSR